MSAETTERGDGDLREQLERALGFLRRALRSWPIAAGSLLLGCLACAVFLYFNQPRYRSETVIFYAENGNTADAAEPTATRAVTLRLKELLLSRPTLEHVIVKFDPYPEIRRSLGIIDAVEELKKHIDFRAPGGDTISIAVDASSPSQAQKITAELAEQVIASDSDLRKTQARASLDFLTNQKQAAESQLREAEQGLASFMAQHPRFALDATPLTSGAAIRASLAGAAPGATGPSLPRVFTPSAMGTKPSELAALPPAAPRPGSEAPPSRALARAAVAAARQNLAEQLARYTPAHPDVRAAQAALVRATERLAAVESASSGGEQPTNPAPAAAASAVAAPAVRQHAVWTAPPALAANPRTGEQAKELVELETQWLQLTRAVTEAHQRQDQLDGQWFKADIEASSERAGHGVQVNVIDPAFLPERPLPPGRSLIALMFAGASLLLGALAASIRAALDDRLFAARDLGPVSELLVEIPKLSKERSARAAI